MRNVLKFLLTLVVGAAIIWIGFWWYAQGRLQSGFQAWAEKQAANGWKISYDSLQRGISPANAEITVTNLTLTPPPTRNIESATLALPAVTLRIAALDPLVFHADLPDRIAVTLGNGFGVVINTGSSSVAENLDPNALFNRQAYPFRGGEFAASDIDVLASQGSLLVVHIDSLSSRADVNLAAGANATALSTTTILDGLAPAPLLARIAGLPFDGRLTHLAVSLTLSGPVPANLSDIADRLNAAVYNRIVQQKILAPVVHQWAAQGGNGSTTLNLVLGPSTLATNGTVKFDANLQPLGTADLTADHLDQFTAALIASYPTLQGDIEAAEAQLSLYLSNSEQGGQTLTLRTRYGAGNVNINGQKVSAMPPLDWNRLENPLPPPLQAPGDGSGAQAQ